MFGCFEEDEFGRGGLAEGAPLVVFSAGDEGMELRSGAMLSVWSVWFCAQ